MMLVSTQHTYSFNDFFVSLCMATSATERSLEVRLVRALKDCAWSKTVCDATLFLSSEKAPYICTVHVGTGRMDA